MLMRLVSDTIVDALVNLGLTFNEARAYKALVRNGPSSARQVAEISEVPRSKVYETLDLLEKRGFIQRLLGKRPAVYKALPPKATIEHLQMRMKTSGDAALTALESLEKERETSDEEFVWTVQGRDQIGIDIVSTFDNAKQFIYIATRLPSLLNPLRGALARARRRGVQAELHTTKLHLADFNEFRHYLDVQAVVPSSKILLENVGQVLQDVDIESIGWNPDAISIMVIDGVESIAVFEPNSKRQKPWSLHIKNPLIVVIQWQVIKTVLSAIDSFTSG